MGRLDAENPPLMTARRLLSAGLLLAASLFAHVGSPDVFYEGAAGPYRLFVTIRPPVIVPGVAEIEIRSSTAGVRAIRIVPLPLTGPGAKLAPTADTTRRSKEDPQYFTGSLWLMSVGAWQVRIHAEGDQGVGELSVPVPALPTRIETMQTGIGALLFGLMLLLAAGLVSIVGAGVREGQLEPGVDPPPSRIRYARVTMAATTAGVFALLILGNQWWNSEAGAYSRIIYKPLELAPSLEPNGRLILRLNNPGWMRRRVDDLIPDHTHLMHMYVISLPDMDQVWHLHPEQIEPGAFAQNLPDMPAGRYQLFADVVHQSGIPETLTAEMTLPQIAGSPLTGDDSHGSHTPRPDSPRIVWVNSDAPLRARQPTEFRFRVEPGDGVELYMGMQGHAAFVKRDLTVFAHVHPSGSVPMAALTLTNSDAHAGHSITSAPPPEVSFPFGLPQPGAYRIYVQIKVRGRVETGVFDAQVN